MITTAGPGVATPSSLPAADGPVLSRIGVASGGSGIVDGQGEAEGRAAAGPVLGPDAAAVSVDDAAADGQPESGPGHAGRGPAIELLEGPLLIPGRESRAPVCHLDRRDAPGNVDRDLERSS